MPRKSSGKSQGASEARVDGWVSVLTGLGTRRDKRTSYQFVASTPLDPETCEGLYDSNDLAAWICDAYPEEAMREGIELTIPDDKDSADAVLDRLEELDALAIYTDAMVTAATVGAGAVLIGVNDDQELPLELDAIKKIEWLKCVSRRDVSPVTYYQDPLHPKHGKPELYTFSPILQGATLPPKQARIHESRLVWFEGTRTSDRSKSKNGGWPFSKLQRLMPIVQSFDVAWEGASYMMSDASQAVFKLHGLLNALASAEGARLLERRMEVVERTRGIARAIALDPEKGEDFQKIATTFTGVPDMLDRFADRLAAAARMPVTILLGKSPAGLNATGKSDLQIWYDRVRAYQRQEVKPALEIIVQAVLSELNKTPKSWSICFPELERMSPVQEADLRNKQAQTDKLMIDGDVVSPEEIAVSRYSDKGWSAETTINLKPREIILATPVDEQPDNGDGGTIGARAKAVTELLDTVAHEKLPPENAIAILINVFGMTEDVAKAVLGKVGTSFKLEDEPVVVPGAAPGVGNGKPGTGGGAGAPRPGAKPAGGASGAAPRGAGKPR